MDNSKPMRKNIRAGRDAEQATPRRANTYLMPTLLDRLRDDAPHRQTEAPGEYAVTRTQMREIIQRDLAFLLNATSIDDLIDRERYPLVAASTLNFGVLPLAGSFATTRKWNEIELIIQRAIHAFEPRLIPDSVQVVALTEGRDDTQYNTLAFEIHGMIQMDPYPLEFMVQSSLDLETGQLHVTNMR